VGEVVQLTVIVKVGKTFDDVFGECCGQGPAKPLPAYKPTLCCLQLSTTNESD
jgi:hypothetical protein